VENEMSRFTSIISIALLFFGNILSGPPFVQATDALVQTSLDLAGIGEKAYYGDVCGDVVLFAVGPACDYTWNIQHKNIKTGELGSFFGVQGGTIDTQPKIDGDTVVWCGGPEWEKPWTHEPSNFSVFARNLTSDTQITLREYTMSESYTHPAVSGSKVVWIEHLELDPSPKGKKGKNWWNTSFSICGADITDIENPKYFTIAKNVGTRDPYPCLEYWKSFDNVIDISGNTVVWEADGDIYGADISDLNKIEVFTICSNAAGQYNPAICGETVVWTDQRNDDGDIYGVSILDMKNITPVPVINQSGTQKQPAIDGNFLVYVSSGGDFPDKNDQIEVCRLTEFPKTSKITLRHKYTGQRPAVNEGIVLWRSSGGVAQGVSIGPLAPGKKHINPDACAMDD
jgi:beta propeller repeat protein